MCATVCVCPLYINTQRWRMFWWPTTWLHKIVMYLVFKMFATLVSPGDVQYNHVCHLYSGLLYMNIWWFFNSHVSFIPTRLLYQDIWKCVSTFTYVTYTNETAVSGHLMCDPYICGTVVCPLIVYKYKSGIILQPLYPSWGLCWCVLLAVVFERTTTWTLDFLPNCLINLLCLVIS